MADAGPTADALFTLAPEALLVLRGRRVIRANERVAALAGLDPTGRDITELVPDWRDPPDGEVPFDATLRRVDADDLPVEIRARTSSGGDAIVSFRDARALIAGRDAEIALNEAELRYRSLVEQIPAVVYADDGERTFYVSPQIRDILGVTPDAYRDDPDLWLRLVHPDDRAMVKAESDAFLTGDGGDLTDYRMVRPDGRVVWIRDRAYAFRDDEGRVLWEHGVLFDVTELKEAEARVAHLAYHDSLTGLPNRELFEQTLTLAVERAKRDGTSVGVLYLDLDNFKLVNDSLGHHAGDALLTALAERLRSCTRETDLVARQGGDEFLLVIADIEHGETDPAIRRVADRVLAAMAAPFDLHGVEFHAFGSIGVSVFPRDADSVEGLLRNADVAMYRAKRLEPGGCVLFSADEDDALGKLSYSSLLREAVAEERWMLHYQPVIDLNDRRVVGAEALIRSQDPFGGLLAPGEFIPAAEELGLIEAIGDWVIEEVARQQLAWLSEGLDLAISFNLSPRQLWTPRLADRVVERLRKLDLDPSKLTAEITESTAMADPDRTQRVLRELRAWGLGLAIDDFGTGYSSLSRLKHMPVDILKIDREFIRNVDRDVRLAGMVRAMIQVAHSLEMVAHAEGVETEDEYAFLRANGCRYAQGYWFARPMAADAFADLVRSGAPLGSVSTGRSLDGSPSPT
ncbi:MAG TPA: EAL domain-containing protein [Actinomycetota bacterium]|nr:EAL domain-containing protein [Actinomycetota bacterium]